VRRYLGICVGLRHLVLVVVGEHVPSMFLQGPRDQ
jgi:hypothetical protein